jgi:multiple sugar transport system permease protein
MSWPVFDSFRLSFFRSNGRIESFIGIKNYIWVLSTPLFWKAIWNTMYITFFQILIGIPLAFVIASAINAMLVGKNTVKALFFVPYITPTVASATLFRYVLHADGLLNSIIGLVGLPPIEWLAYPTSAKWGIIVFSVWKSLGFSIIIFLANLQTISPEYYEAAKIDGCSGIKAWRYITIPNMIPTFAFLFVMGWIGGLQRFSDVFVLGNGQGSPERSLYTIVSFIYDRGFGSYEFGLASAASYLLFMMIIVFSAINAKVTKLKV